MNVFEAVKQSVTTRQAAEHYGIHVGRNGMVSDIMSHVFIIKLYPLCCLVSLGSGLLECSACCSNTKHMNWKQRKATMEMAVAAKTAFL